MRKIKIETHIEKNNTVIDSSIILNALTIPESKAYNKMRTIQRKRLSKKGISREQASVPKKKHRDNNEKLSIILLMDEYLFGNHNNA